MSNALPKEWTRHELGDVVSVKSGGTPDRATKEFWGGEIPWVTAKDLKVLDLRDSIERLSPEGAEQVNVVPPGTVLVLVRGMALFKDVPVGVTSVPMTFNQDVKALVPKSDINPRYLAYVLMSMRSALMGRVDRAGHGTGRLATDFLLELPITFPPQAEQERIVRVLGAWNQAIDQTERLLNAKLRRYRGLLNRFCRQAFVEDKAADWPPRKLGSVFVERDERSADLPLLSVTGAKGVIPRDSVDRRSTASEDKSNYKVVRPDDIAYNTMRMWQGVFGKSVHTGIVSPAYTVVTAVDGEIDPVFASHLFNHPRAISLFHRYSQGLVDDTLMLKFPQFAEITVRLPKIERQGEIGRVLETEESALGPQDEYLRALRLQKVSLMQRLVTGQWRLDGHFDIPVLAAPSVVAGDAV